MAKSIYCLTVDVCQASRNMTSFLTHNLYRITIKCSAAVRLTLLGLTQVILLPTQGLSSSNTVPTNQGGSWVSSKFSLESRCGIAAKATYITVLLYGLLVHVPAGPLPVQFFANNWERHKIGLCTWAPATYVGESLIVDSAWCSIDLWPSGKWASGWRILVSPSHSWRFAL